MYYSSHYVQQCKGENCEENYLHLEGVKKNTWYFEKK